MRIRTVLAAVSCLSIGIVVACGSSDDSIFTDPNADAGADEDGGGGQNNNNGFGKDDSGGGGGGDKKDGPTGDGAACASSSSEALLTKRPVDIIFVVDNSGSMAAEIAEVEKQINQNFATIIGASGIDYRVIVIARYGGYDPDESICISSPLSDASCATIFPNGNGTAASTGTRPAETARFYHYNREVASNDGLCRLLDAFARNDSTDGYTLHDGGIGPLLRPNAFKTVVVITDDRVNCSINALRPGGGTLGNRSFNDNDTVVGGENAANAFDLAIRELAPAQFGDLDAGDGGPGVRNYVFHAINGLAPFDGGAPFVDGGVDPKMHPPSAPIVLNECTPDSENSGTGYQGLARLTGGFRYPSCGLDYTSIFREMAKGVVQSSGVSCDFPVPQPAPGETLDLATLAVQYRPGADAGAVQEFTRAANLAACQAGQFWLEGGANGTVHLCPQTCDTVKADLGAKVSVVSGCARINPPNPPSGPK